MSTPEDDRHRLGMFELQKKQKLTAMADKQKEVSEEEARKKQPTSMPAFQVKPPRPASGETEEESKKRKNLQEEKLNAFKRTLPERLKNTCYISEDGTIIFTSAETVGEYVRQNPNAELEAICSDKSGMIKAIKDAKEHGFLKNIKKMTFTDTNGERKSLEGEELQKTIRNVLDNNKPRPSGYEIGT